MTEDLIKLCNRLSLEDKVELRDYLNDAIVNGGVSKSPLRCSILLGELAVIMGVGNIPFESRIPSHVWARCMVAYQMYKEGYTNAQIGHQMQKDHSTVTHMREKMFFALGYPHIYEDIIDIWKQFQKRIQNDIHTGTN